MLKWTASNFVKLVDRESMSERGCPKNLYLEAVMYLKVSSQ